jgi:hypothetical protein
VGGTCGTYGKERNAYGVLVWKPEASNHLEDLGIDGKILLVKWILKNRIGRIGWPRTGFKRRAVVSTVMKLWVPYNAENFLSS